MTYSDIYKELGKLIKGQDKAKRQLIAIFIRHYNQINGFDYSKGERHIVPLIWGKSGSGKTATVEALAKILGVDFCPIFCGQITAEGYKGTNLMEVLGNFYASVGYNKSRMEKSIIFIDEFDKILCKSYKQFDSKTDQSMYLKLLDGGEIYIVNGDIKSCICTNNMLVIIAGAFTDMEDILNKKSKKTGIIQDKVLKDYVLSEVKAMQELNFMDEIIGRISTIIKFEPNDKKVIKEIVRSDHSMYGLWKDYFMQNYGVKLDITEEALEDLAEFTVSSPLGVRALNHYLTPVLLDAMVDAETNYEINSILLDIFKEEKRFTYTTFNGERERHSISINDEDHINLNDIAITLADSEENIKKIVKELADEFGCICTHMNYKELKGIRNLYESILRYLSSECRQYDLHTGSVIKLLNNSFDDPQYKSTFEIMVEQRLSTSTKEAYMCYKKFKNCYTIYDNKTKNIAIQAVKNFEIHHEKERRIENNGKIRE